MVVVELARPQQAGVQGGGPAQGLLLGLGAVEVAAARVAGRGEVEDGDLAAQAPGGLQAALAGDLEDRAHRGGRFGRHGARPVHARARPGRLGRLGDGHLAAVGRAVGPGRDDLLRPLCDAPQARAHGATPVDAVTACRAVSPVVLMRESWVMLGRRCNGVSRPGRRRVKPPQTGGSRRLPSGNVPKCILVRSRTRVLAGTGVPARPTTEGPAARWTLRRIPTCPIRLVAVSGHVPPSVRRRSRHWSTASASRPVRPGSWASRWSGSSTTCGRPGSRCHPNGSTRCTPRCGACP